MHTIEKHFAWINLLEDRVEEAKTRKNEIVSVGMLCNPEVTRQYVRHLELEEEMTDDDREQIAEEKIREMTEAGAVKSDPVVRKMIQMKNETVKKSQPIETLTDLMEEDGI